jgi:uncharacterized OsmC-like protein
MVPERQLRSYALSTGRTLEHHLYILRNRTIGSGKELRVADVTYVSRVRVEVAEHYGVSPEEEEPHASTLDYVVAAAGGWLLGTFRGGLVARQVSYEDLRADTVGEIETEGKVLVIKRIKQIFYLTAEEKDRTTIERVLEVYADSCPVARSIKDCIEISSELEFIPV